MRMNYARRQQYRRLSRAGRLGLVSAGAAGLALFLVRVGAAGLGALLLVVAGVVGLRARHWLSLAGRSRVGARSEDEVRCALAPLQGEGWRLCHALRWPGRGDIDSVAIAPSGLGFAIETKTRTFEDRHVMRVREQAMWLARRRRRWCRRGALGVLCVVRARGLDDVEHDVLVVSIEHLIPTLRNMAVDWGDSRWRPGSQRGKPDTSSVRGTCAG
jgi:hypothetical protein